MLTIQDGILIALALVAVGLLVLLVTRWKVNAFIALVLASLVVGGGAVVMGIEFKTADGTMKPLGILDVVSGFQAGMGTTLGGIAAVIGLGIMLGKLLAESSGAEVLAKRFSHFFGPQRVGWCIMALALAVGLTTWFAVGLVLLLPILLTLTRETRKPFLLLAIPLISTLSVMHGLMPPHPGPVVAIATLHANTGMVLLWGFIIGIPVAFVAGPIFARRAARRVEAQPPPMPDLAKRAELIPPPFGLTLFSILLPVALMLLGTIAELVLEKSSPVTRAALFFGHPTMALLIAVLFATWSLGTRCGYRPAQLLTFSEQSIATIGMTLLVVGGGGGFARVLNDGGVAKAMGALATQAHLPPLLYGWLVAAFIRVATGSATVSITAASGLLVPVLAQHPEVNVELLIVAIGCGSLFLSHLNDGGFWIVKECLGLSVSQTLRTWTITETIVGILGLLLTLVVHSVWQMFHH